MRVLLALGGNAMTAPDGSATPAAQIEAIGVAMRAAARLVAAGHEVVLTHGNGPQVGNLLVKNELAAHVVPPVPLDWCGAQTQGTHRLHARSTPSTPRSRARGLAAPRRRARHPHPRRRATTRGFTHPTQADRPLPARASRRRRSSTTARSGRTAARRAGAGSSPRPSRSRSSTPAAVRALLEAGYVVVAAGGGGIPVVRERRRPAARRRGRHRQGPHRRAARPRPRRRRARHRHRRRPRGRSTGAPPAQRDARPGDRSPRCGAYAADGQFASGSMGPKVEAAIRFVAGGGPRSVITSLTHIADAVEGDVGTVIEPLTRPLETEEGDSRARRHRGPQGPAPHRVRRLRAGRSSSTTACIEADRVVAVIGKTEGNGGVNDYTRIIADRAFREVLVDEGHPRAERGQADPDRLVRRHRRRASARTPRSSPRVPGRPGRADRRAAADRRLRDERARCCPRTSAASR